MKSLTRLTLRGTRVDDISAIAHLTALTDLDLSGAPIDDAGLAPIVALTRLTSLNLDNTKVTNAGVAYLKNLTKLDHLVLSETRVDDNAAAVLAGLTALDTLQLGGTQVTDATVVRLGASAQIEDLGRERHKDVQRGSRCPDSLPVIANCGDTGNNCDEVGLVPPFRKLGRK